MDVAGVVGSWRRSAILPKCLRKGVGWYDDRQLDQCHPTRIKISVYLCVEVRIYLGAGNNDNKDGHWRKIEMPTKDTVQVVVKDTCDDHIDAQFS